MQRFWDVLLYIIIGAMLFTALVKGGGTTTKLVSTLVGGFGQQIGLITGQAK